MSWDTSVMSIPPRREIIRPERSAPEVAAWIMLVVAAVLFCQAIYFDVRTHDTLDLMQQTSGDLDKLRDQLRAAVEQQDIINGKLLAQLED